MKFPLQIGAVLVLSAIFAPAQERLPGTELLTWTGDLSPRMHEAALRDVDGMIADAAKNRWRYWNDSLPSIEAYQRSVAGNRERFKQVIGLVDPRVPAAMERFGDDENPALVSETKTWRAYQVRWPVLDGVTGEGLLLEPRGKCRGFIVALPDADQTPEQLAGLTPGPYLASPIAWQLAEHGFEVLIPTLIDRSDAVSGNPQIAMTNQPHREWIHRQAYMMGRHIIGYEVQKVLAALDWFDQRRAASAALKDAPIGVAGYGEGGLIAFYAGAVDARIEVTFVSGYFKPREQTWQEPLYRNVWGLLRQFGDAEIGTLIAPRGLVVEYADEPAVNGPPPADKLHRDCAAPGKLVTPPAADVQKEFARISSILPHYRALSLVVGSGGWPGSVSAIGEFVEFLDHHGSEPPRKSGVRFLGIVSSAARTPLPDSRQHFDPAARQARQVRELEDHIQHLVRDSNQVRNAFFLHKVMPEFANVAWNYNLRFPPKPVEAFVAAAKGYQKVFWEEVIGKLGTPVPPLNPRSRKIYDELKWSGYEVVLDVGGEGFAWGVLCLPKDLRPGEKRPVVVCQHGRNGVPAEVITGDKPAYHDFAARLAERGFITFAPHNLYRNEANYRMLSRKANTVGLSMFSFILRHHEQWLRWLGSLPEVDAQRIAFYGLSYGGETAVRVPPLLDGYCLSICSGDFNDWPRKVVSTHDRPSFMFTGEWEMPYFNMGNTFSYAELTYLMFPRPFMVERGHHDGVSVDSWVASEFAKTRWLYAQFGFEDRTRIEFFNGGHTINGKGTFEFLHEQLRWPQPPAR